MAINIGLILVIVTLAMGLILLLDKLFFARRRTGKMPVIVDISRSVFPVILIVLLIRSFLGEPFRSPSGSMMPTLLVGDFILVNKFAYGLRLPVTHTKILDTGSPERGDVAVFRYPVDDKTDFIKRIVAVPGDTVAYRNKRLYINGEAQPVTVIGRYRGVGSGALETNDLHARENLMGLEHEILIDERYPDFNPQCRTLAHGTITVPEGHYFAMGDNRDNSNDSRCWGLVPEENLVGKATFIWMNFDMEVKGSPINWGRIGNAID
ncbi:MAG: signal peptidase I [Gammaproteobacteria bacterium]